MTDTEIVVRVSSFARLLRQLVQRSTDADLQRWHDELVQFYYVDSDAIHDFVAMALSAIRGEIAVRYTYQPPREGFRGPHLPGKRLTF